MQNNGLIEVSGLSFHYPGSNVRILNKINLQINSGEFVSIVGGNGSGKSTLAKLFNGLLVPAEGVVVVCGAQTTDSGLLFEIRQQVGMVFQNPDMQIVATIVEEDVAFALENLCYSEPEIEGRVDEVLKLVSMTNFKQTPVHNLSGGQKQRVAIAGVLAMKPKCVVFDEATSMLDPRGRKQVVDVMNNLNKHGTTIINITHNMTEVVESDRVVVLHNGELLKDCSPKQLFADELVLKKVNLQPLPVTELVNLLAAKGLLKRQTVLSVEECVNLIAEILKGSFNCQ